MEIKTDYVSFNGYKTFYRIVNPNGKKTPLILLHGGPGSTHNSFEVLDSLAFKDDRPIIMYDQLGCGLSSLDGSYKKLWVKDTWLEELINLREKLNIEECHILGHSFGGMLLIMYLCDYYPSMVKSAILSSTLSSVKLWSEETHRLITYLSKEDQESIKIAEETNNFSSLEFVLANKHYSEKFISGPFIKGMPECLLREKKRGVESYITAWGESEFTPSGTLRFYEYTDKLHKISCPVLLFSGCNDESTPYQNKNMFDNITSSKEWFLFKNSRHMSYFEENELYINKLISFLNSVD